MNDKTRVLVISNGAGEDSIAAEIIKNIKRVSVDAMPLVGEGNSYKGTAPICGPTKLMPSGGLIPQGLQNLFKDIAGGLGGLIFKQIAWMRSNREKYKSITAVGDLWPVILAILSGIRPITFIGTAKSNYHHAYSALEAFVLRFGKVHSLVRDEITAQALRSQNVNAEWVGNAMMDGLVPQDIDFKLAEGEIGIALFPGSRQATYDVWPRLVSLIEKLSSESGIKICALTAAAPSIDTEQLASRVSGLKISGCPYQGWEALQHTDSESRGTRFFIVKNHLADVLKFSTAALGLAGTAHEQAAGWGIPTVAYEPGGEKCMKWYRARQKGLLGDALIVTDDSDREILDALTSLIKNPGEIKRRGDIGKMRLGPPGGAVNMAAVIERTALGS